MSNFDEIGEIDLPSMSENQQEYLQENQETSFTNLVDQQTTKTRVRELSNNLVENVPFELEQRFRLHGKRLQFRKGGEWKDLTRWDGTFKQKSQIGLIFKDPHDEVSTATKSRTEIVKQEVKKFYKHIGNSRVDSFLNLDRFKVKNENNFNILYYKKNSKFYTLTNKTDETFNTPKELEKIITKTQQQQLGLSSIEKLNNITPTSEEIDSLELKDLSSTITELTDVIGETSQTSLPMRELLGLDKALQRIQGELVNGTSKLTELEQDIAKNQRKLNPIRPGSNMSFLARLALI